MVRRLVAWAMIFAILAALTFLLIPDASARVVLVSLFTAIAVIATVWLVLLVAIRFIRGRRSKSWTIALVAVLVLESVLAFGLNVYADSKTVSSTALIQDYYAEVADAVSLGNAVLAGQAPAGVTFATVQAQASRAESGLTALDVPAELADFRSSVDLWASGVATDAQFAKNLNMWQNVAFAPDPFTLTMTADKAEAAFARSLRQVATLNTFGKRAQALHNLEGTRYVGARLDAQSFWLQALNTSADPNGVQAQLRFVEALSYRQEAATSDVALAARIVRSWPKPRTWSRCHATGFVPCNIPWIQGQLGHIWRGSLDMQNTYTTPTPEMTAAEKELEAIPPMDTAGGVDLGGVGSGYQAENPAPPAFADKCKAAGGTIGDPVYDRTKSRIPSSEGGWTCKTQNNRCFDLLTYSGSEYLGGESGCPEQGLVPATLFKTYNPPVNKPSLDQSSPKPAPTDQCPPGYPFYNPADKKCYQQDPTIRHCQPGYTYNPADGLCHQPAPAHPSFDGIYDYTYLSPGPGGTETHTFPVRIASGVISSSGGEMTGRVSSTGAVTFTLPCPINSGSASGTGTLNATSRSGSGTYQCNEHPMGGTPTWRLVGR
jgi:hypothetical protein